MVYLLLRFISFVLLKVFFRMEVVGKANIPGKGGFILASNHVSYMDPVAVGVACPRKLNYMARHDLFSKRGFAWLLTHLHVFPVKRDSADLSAIKEAMRRVQAGEGLLLFPEGGRTTEDEARDPQPGIGFLTAKLEVPVIPVSIKGSDKALPKGVRFPRFTKVRVRFGQQVTLEKKMPYEEIARAIMASIRYLDPVPCAKSQGR
jgi:1-acyl-sn-glycerol-3-phosphate acyltransferase